MSVTVFAEARPLLVGLSAVLSIGRVPIGTGTEIVDCEILTVSDSESRFESRVTLL
jgi:hypothetical protein